MRTSVVLGTLAGGFVVAAVGPRWTMAVADLVAVMIGLITVFATREREPARAVETTRAG
jgi:hypothetical protein